MTAAGIFEVEATVASLNVGSTGVYRNLLFGTVHRLLRSFLCRK
jgi:hypothetical protein